MSARRSKTRGTARTGSSSARSGMASTARSAASDETGFSVESSKQILKATREETRRIMTRQIKKRQQVKQQYLEERKRAENAKGAFKADKERKWVKKTDKSPFLIDLVADQERIHEENKVRLREQARRQRAIEARKRKVKNDIILKALSEQSDLEALRMEKRAIQLEEKRLKALLDLERAQAHRKADLIAAQRAEKHRKEAQSAYQREQTRLRALEARRVEQE
eukprot:CAMPEP_0203821884 /NCGR_PEP_ID=MMETSP0115-20131106/44636_1 /ASSEMBLY_ACC=CAM_ASM_000227 /TAXON_ID=33651 /ORGANISM="Bicosoecid sp, Strain ms1" /LENGTH=222 /DNA_ID=CAMNT_0050730913 /DNA_START=186 /DNA_END=851 /DNA_ORIENTATION=+